MNDLAVFISRCFANPSVPVAISGAPGCGKTAQIEAFARYNNIPLVKLLASTLDETDVAGIVVRDGNTARTLSPAWYERLKEGRGILFLDEFNCARKEVLDTLLTLVCSRTLPNGDKLGDGVLIIAAMNPCSICDNTELSPAMRTRFIWLDYEVGEEEWLEWAVSTGTEYNESVLAEKDYLTYDKWIKWFHANEKNDKDKRDLLRKAIKLGLKFDTGQDMVDKPLPTTQRGLMNLCYWARSAYEMGTVAGFFIGEEATAIIKSISTEAADNICNRIWTDSEYKVSDNKDAKETAKKSRQKKITDKIQAAVNG